MGESCAECAGATVLLGDFAVSIVPVGALLVTHLRIRNLVLRYEGSNTRAAGVRGIATTVLIREIELNLDAYLEKFL